MTFQTLFNPLPGVFISVRQYHRSFYKPPPPHQIFRVREKQNKHRKGLTKTNERTHLGFIHFRSVNLLKTESGGKVPEVHDAVGAPGNGDP